MVRLVVVALARGGCCWALVVPQGHGARGLLCGAAYLCVRLVLAVRVASLGGGRLGPFGGGGLGAGPLRVVGWPLNLEGTPPASRRHPPMLGEHTDEVLRELAADD